jgi:hypothetical protein
MFGHVESIELMEKEEHEQNTEASSSALVTFDTRGSAENAKANGSKLILADSTGVELCLSWYKIPSTSSVKVGQKVEVAVETSQRNEDDSIRNKFLADDAMVDYEEDEDEDWE